MEQSSSKKNKFYPPAEAVENARAALALRKTLPKSRRGSLEPEEAQSMGIRSGVAAGQALAASEGLELPDWRDYLRTLNRFRGMAYRAMDQGKGPERSKAVQVFYMWGGDAMLEACKEHLENHG